MPENYDEYIEKFISAIHYPRRINIWARKNYEPCLPAGGKDCSWLTPGEADKDVLRMLIKKYLSAGVSKAYFDNDEGKWLRDLLVYEFDIYECKENPSFTCVKQHFNLKDSPLYGVGSPVIYYNGGKSIYLIYFLDTPVEETWVPKVIPKNIDMSQLSPMSPFRIPFTLHPKTKSRGFTVDWDLKPTDFIIQKTSTLDLMEPQKRVSYYAPSSETHIRRKSKSLIAEWDALINWMIENHIKLTDCRERFAIILGEYCVQKGLTLGECKELLRKLIENPDKRKYERRIEYYYENPDKAKYLPSVRSFLGLIPEKDEWYVCDDKEQIEKLRLFLELIGTQ